MMKLNDEYLALMSKLAHDIKVASYAQLNLQPGSWHLEVGSGNGHDSITLAELHPESSVLGIDLNEDIVKVANQRVQEKGLGNVRHLVGDAAVHPFVHKFHSMRAERVFQHLNDEQIHALVKHLAGHSEKGCVFSMVGVDWESLTCTVDRKHRDIFRTLKQFLIDISNTASIHTAIEAFESQGYTTGEIEVYNYTARKFDVAMMIFNMEKLASELAIDSERMEAWRADFLDDRHYFSVTGCTAPFAYQGR